ncbi:hypothetical protein ACIP8Z_07030 [Streptomyces sp. NPDC088553]|uniref:hypothetical protein n=1 Tax=Streptomyces sp. NPDC088553 TaxID=3365864 RepID=UPI003818B1CF
MGTEGSPTIVDIDRVVATDDPPTRSGIADYGPLCSVALNHRMHPLREQDLIAVGLGQAA